MEDEAFLALAREPLDPELAAYLEEDGPLGPMIRHPLVYQVCGIIPGMVNRQLRYKREALKLAEEQEDWETYVFLHERPYRMDALRKLIGRTPKQVLAKLARRVWVDSENLPDYLDDWNWMFLRTEGYDWMSADEEKALNKLPDVLTVYRGVCDDTHRSWSLDRGVAEFFARRKVNKSTGEVLVGTVNRTDVFAYLTSRSEEEILVRNPEDVTVKETYFV